MEDDGRDDASQVLGDSSVKDSSDDDMMMGSICQVTGDYEGFRSMGGKQGEI